MKKSDMVRGMLFGAEFFTNLFKEVVKLGGDEEQMFKRMKTSEFAKEVAKLIVVGINTTKIFLHVLASTPFADRIAHGKYDWVKSDITEEHFPTNVSTDYDAEYKLYHFNRSISSDDAIKEMDKDGFRPAILPELLVLGETQPELQREFPIVAIGSVWRGSNDFCYVPVLDRDAAERGLNLSWFEHARSGSYRFLAVRK